MKRLSIEETFTAIDKVTEYIQKEYPQLGFALVVTNYGGATPVLCHTDPSSIDGLGYQEGFAACVGLNVCMKSLHDRARAAHLKFLERNVDNPEEYLSKIEKYIGEQI